MSTPPNPTVAANPQPSQIQTAPNLVHFDPKAAVPSQPIYFQRNDFFAFQFLSNNSNVIFRIDYRWLTPEGEIKEGEFNGQTTGQSGFFSFPLFEGWLLSFTARVTSGIFAGQWNFMQAVLVRSASVVALGPEQALIWQGYIPNGAANGWPGQPSKEVTDGPGTIRSINSNIPGAGNDIFFTLPANRRWILLAARMSLSTSAAVANRVPGFQITDGLNVLFFIHTNVAQVAGATIAYNLAPGNQFFTDGAAVNPNQLIPLPTQLQLKTNFVFQTASNGLQAGDQWTAAQFLVLEWGLWDN